MLVVNKVSDNLLTVKCNYSTDYVDRFRKVLGTYFDNTNKLWCIPITSFGMLEIMFRGELVYKTPRWIIANEPPPDYSQMYKIDPSIVLPGLKLSLYDYQRYGSKFMIDRLLSRGFVINADACGLGSSLQVVDFKI